MNQYAPRVCRFCELVELIIFIIIRFWEHKMYHSLAPDAPLNFKPYLNLTTEILYIFI